MVSQDAYAGAILGLREVATDIEAYADLIGELQAKKLFSLGAASVEQEQLRLRTWAGRIRRHVDLIAGEQDLPPELQDPEHAERTIVGAFKTAGKATVGAAVTTAALLSGLADYDEGKEQLREAQAGIEQKYEQVEEFVLEIIEGSEEPEEPETDDEDLDPMTERFWEDVKRRVPSLSMHLEQPSESMIRATFRSESHIEVEFVSVASEDGPVVTYQDITGGRGSVGVTVERPTPSIVVLTLQGLFDLSRANLRR